jgi:hypothetical protein
MGKPANDMDDFYDQSKTLMDAPGINTVFSFNDEEHTRYGASSFGDSLIVARNLAAANKGTRFIQTTLGGWDHHSDIYSRDAAYVQATQLDNALGARSRISRR